MKELLYKAIIIVSILITIAVVLICFLTTKIKLNYNEKVYSIEVHVPGVRGIRTSDKDVIKETINKVNKIKYYKYNIYKNYNKSPDGRIVLYDKDRRKIESIELFGETAVYGNERFTILPFTYGKLERLCREINDK